MNKLPAVKRAAIIRALIEGNSVRSTARMTDTSKATVLKLLVEVGEFCSTYQDNVLRNLPCKRVEADEILAYVGATQKNATKDGQGDLWTYAAIDADKKLMISWLVGSRNHANTQAFMVDLSERLAGRVQLTTGGLGWYRSAVENAFGWKGTDYAEIIKTFGLPRDQSGNQRRYSPLECTVIVKLPVMGKQDEKLISTSYVERQNLNIRMQQLRFTRSTNGFSKKAENHAHAVSLNFFYHNFCRAHQTLTKAANGIKTTPAMASGLTDQMWPIEELLGMMPPKTSLHSK